MPSRFFASGFFLIPLLLGGWPMGLLAQQIGAPKAGSACSDAKVLTGLSGRAVAVAFFPAGTQIVAAGVDGSIKVWNRITGRPTVCYDSREGYFTGMAIDPTGSLLAVACHSRKAKQVLLMDAAKLTVRKEIEAYAVGLCFSNDGKSLLVLRVHDLATYDPHTGRERGRIIATADFREAISVAIHRSEQMAAVTLFCVDGSWVAEWNIAGRSKLERVTGYMGRTYDIAYAPDCEFLLVGTLSSGAFAGSNVRHPYDFDRALWLYAKGKPRVILEEGPLDVTAVAFGPDGRRVASAHAGRGVRVWEVATRRPLAELCHPKDCWITCLAFSADGHVLAAGGGSRSEGRGWRGDGQVFVWKLD